MTPKVNLKSIAKDLNLSTGTVSRVLNGKAKDFRISEETVKKVVDYASKTGYSPNMVAKGLRDSKTYTIGLMIPDITNPFFAMMAKQIEKAASEANYSMLLVDAEENLEKEKKQVDNMLSRKVDGVIAAPVGTSYKHFSAFKQNNIPLVFVDRYFKDSEISFVSSDNFQGAYDATKHLINYGHKAIAVIKGDGLIEPVIERKRGFYQAMDDSNITINPAYIVGDSFSIDNGYSSAKQLLGLTIPPTAIIAFSNLIGLGVLRAVKELNLNIPKNISLIVFDEQPYVEFINPPLTTVKQNSKDIGYQAINLLLETIANKNATQTSIYIPVKLMQRESVLAIK